MMNKEQLRIYFNELKKEKFKPNKKLEMYLNLINREQQKIICNFDTRAINIRQYDLPFKKLEFVNAISSAYYTGRVGRRYDLLVYHSDVPIGYIQLASPVMNSRLASFLKTKYKTKKLDFKMLNQKVCDVSVCVSIGETLRPYLIIKLLIFIAMSKEIIQMYNKKYNTNIEVLYTTSVFGKSSVYNRVRNLHYLGLTEGWHNALTKEQIATIYAKYHQYFPQRKINVTALAPHIIRLYLHLKEKNIDLGFEIPKLRKGVYACTTFLPLNENIDYWYNRWFIPRKHRIENRERYKCFQKD